jgi:hypothetical protein
MRSLARARYAAVGLSLAAAIGVGAACFHCAPRGGAPAPSESERPAATGELPGSAPRPPALRDKLASALAAKGADYKPRTEHKKPDGFPKYTNRLILEASPYLLQHAHNPVDWYPWGEEAFEAARREGKPVFLSVGYSTCHWCHVMERESFEDEAIAAYMNQHYIAIKVDREERPDVDALYMNAVFMIGGSGGWPMTVVMTEDRKPFFAGTYFPPRDGERRAKRGLHSILKELAERYASDKAALVERASEVTKRIQAGIAVAGAGGEGGLPGIDLVAKVVEQLDRAFDPTHGGFGGAPKFPRSAEIELLLRHHRRTGDARALEMATRTLDKMAEGGIFDHVGGGFHRYATDARWLVPHFEKMLYDNAQLAVSYLEAYQATGSARYASVARATLDYVLREMTAPGGGFYSATDADSEGKEGEFFVWTPAEIAAAVGRERARVVEAYFAVTPKGNFEGKNILHTPRPAADVAKSLGMTEEALAADIEASRALLYEARKKRVPPLRDDKILTSWNGLMISAMARGGFTLAEPRYIEAARSAADLLLRKRSPSGRLVRNAASGASAPAFLDDYAFCIAGLLDLHHATSEDRWLTEAKALSAELEAHHWDSEKGGFFLTADDAEKLFTRDKPDYDGAEPSGNSVAAHNLCRLAELTSNTKYQQAAERTLTAFSTSLRRGPRSLPKMLAAVEFCTGDPLEIAVVSPPTGAPQNNSGGKPRSSPGSALEPLLQKLRRSFVPNHVLVLATQGEDLERKAKDIPLLDQKIAKGGLPTAYVCRGSVCKMPTSDPAVLAKQLDEAGRQ